MGLWFLASPLAQSPRDVFIKLFYDSVLKCVCLPVFPQESKYDFLSYTMPVYHTADIQEISTEQRDN